jgi:hypothetical protein
MANKTINEAFAKIFKQIRGEQVFVSNPTAAGLDDHVEIKAAFSKCIDFNVIVNRDRSNNDEAFLFLSGLRGIAEDLIVLKYSLKFSAGTRATYFQKLRELNLRQGILAQRNFFESNNPFQYVVGKRNSMQESQAKYDDAKNALQEFWKTNGFPKNGPTVKEMSEAVGLSTVYNYIYFAASNFVHFNPHALLRTGWGPMDGPFTFSIENFGGYYRDLAAVYGAILYLGFAVSFGSLLQKEEELRTGITEIESILVRTPRWPEIVTFEELNIPRPEYASSRLMHALLGIKDESKRSFLFINILNEIKALPA